MTESYPTKLEKKGRQSNQLVTWWHSWWSCRVRLGPGSFLELPHTGEGIKFHHKTIVKLYLYIYIYTLYSYELQWAKVPLQQIYNWISSGFQPLGKSLTSWSITKPSRSKSQAGCEGDQAGTACFEKLGWWDTSYWNIAGYYRGDESLVGKIYIYIFFCLYNIVSYDYMGLGECWSAFMNFVSDHFSMLWG